MPATGLRVTGLRADILVLGGGLGGIAATLAALRLGRRVVLAEALDWLGGQLTAQGVPFDEHPWIELGVGSQSYATLRQRIRDYYRRHYPLSEQARAASLLNPGMGNVGTLCHEPRVAVRVIDDLLAPFESNRRLAVLRRHALVSAERDGDRITGVTLRDLASGRHVAVEAAIVIDASETGELLEAGGVEHVFGAEAARETGELHALTEADPFDQQSLTWCFALDYLPEQDHTIDRPARYAEFRDLKLDFWPNRQFDWTVSDHVTHKPLQRALFTGDSDADYLFDLWHARRIAWRRNFAPGFYESDITIANWPQMDYWLKPAIGVTEAEHAAALEEARQFSLSFLYWMQTEAPRHDGGQGYRGLRLRGDVLGTNDGLAKQVYYREGRRLRAELTVLEQHIGVAARPGASAAQSFPDSVGIGAYRIDLHPSTSRLRDTVDIDSYPFEIPLGALLPVRVDNLLPGCKNLGTTRITSGAYRVHPVEWSIGEASGTLAAFALAHGIPPRAVRADPGRLAALQQLLVDGGAPIRWPSFGALTPRTRRGYRPGQP
ncbi:FAD-dependent oxidoreductase [Reyranella sp.]|uniref:FAD-dependent oxidoreductase n=1 Tax=Reyranella sp. TaxID=1929291 RepID=UPI003783BBB1